MWFCQRLVLTGRFSRSVVMRSGSPPGLAGNQRLGGAACRWEGCKFRKYAVTPLTVVRLCSTKNNQESPDHPRTLVHVLKWGVLTVLVTTAVGTTVIWWEMWLLKRNMTSMMSSFTSNQMVTSMPDHQLKYRLYNYSDPSTDISSGGTAVWLPWIQSKSQDPFTLLDLCQSNDQAIRRIGVKAMAAKTTWEDFQYRYVAQAADCRTLIALSRSRGADPRFFLPQPPLVTSKTSVLDDLAYLLLGLDQHMRNRDKDGIKMRGPTNRATSLAQQHIQHQHRATDDKRHFWGFDGSSLDVVSVDRPLPEDQLLLQFLATLTQLCCKPEEALQFIKRRGLSALQRVTEQYESTEVFTSVAALLGNLALHTGVHETIVRTGWLGVLKSWCEGKNGMLAVTAARVLNNMDRDWTTEVLEDGIIILHPLHRSRKTVHADVIFVHGLLGGAVKTWRQQDRGMPPLRGDSDSSQHTDCWPKDWLAEDCPHVRILSVHYDTALTTWSADNSICKDKCTLKGRSRELLDKLSKAMVGTRPIIWVGHSMGGLLIKQMLELSEGGHHSAMQQNTCGVLMYSVPHRGLSLAALTSQIHFLLYPSTEVQELSIDSPHLHQLHDYFKHFVETHGIPCLSFGEMNKTKFRKTLPKLLLVPTESSDPGVGEFCALPLDHINICKPDSRDSTLYQRSLAFMHRAIFYSYMHRLRQAVSSGKD